MSGLAPALRRSWTHSLLPFLDAMYKAVWPYYVNVKAQTTMIVSVYINDKKFNKMLHFPSNYRNYDREVP